ncbi:MAG: hypothetical protein JJV93_03015 [Alphaproteobacteria bacterium]|nr:hypothetical protein [Alphaproteobacteria bacterium]
MKLFWKIFIAVVISLIVGKITLSVVFKIYHSDSFVYTMQQFAEKNYNLEKVSIKDISWKKLSVLQVEGINIENNKINVEIGTIEINIKLKAFISMLFSNKISKEDIKFITLINPTIVLEKDEEKKIISLYTTTDKIIDITRSLDGTFILKNAEVFIGTVKAHRVNGVVKISENKVSFLGIGALFNSFIKLDWQYNKLNKNNYLEISSNGEFNLEAKVNLGVAQSHGHIDADKINLLGLTKFLGVKYFVNQEWTDIDINIDADFSIDQVELVFTDMTLETSFAKLKGDITIPISQGAVGTINVKTDFMNFDQASIHKLPNETKIEILRRLNITVKGTGNFFLNKVLYNSIDISYHNFYKSVFFHLKSDDNEIKIKGKVKYINDKSSSGEFSGNMLVNLEDVDFLGSTTRINFYCDEMKGSVYMLACVNNSMTVNLHQKDYFGEGSYYFKRPQVKQLVLNIAGKEISASQFNRRFEGTSINDFLTDIFKSFKHNMLDLTFNFDTVHFEEKNLSVIDSSGRLVITPEMIFIPNNRPVVGTLEQAKFSLSGEIYKSKKRNSPIIFDRFKINMENIKLDKIHTIMPEFKQLKVLDTVVFQNQTDGILNLDFNGELDDLKLNLQFENSNFTMLLNYNEIILNNDNEQNHNVYISIKDLKSFTAKVQSFNAINSWLVDGDVPVEIKAKLNKIDEEFLRLENLQISLGENVFDGSVEINDDQYVVKLNTKYLNVDDLFLQQKNILGEWAYRQKPFFNVFFDIPNLSLDLKIDTLNTGSLEVDNVAIYSQTVIKPSEFQMIKYDKLENITGLLTVQQTPVNKFNYQIKLENFDVQELNIFRKHFVKKYMFEDFYISKGKIFGQFSGISKAQTMFDLVGSMRGFFNIDIINGQLVSLDLIRLKEKLKQPVSLDKTVRDIDLNTGVEPFKRLSVKGDWIGENIIANGRIERIGNNSVDTLEFDTKINFFEYKESSITTRWTLENYSENLIILFKHIGRSFSSQNVFNVITSYTR